jgi:small subunit ribosomal protein S16
VAVRIRMKRMGRTHRPFYRICAVDGRAARDGRVIEELGHYDPMLSETDARTVLKNDRVAYWLGVGAQPSENVAVLIKKYGENGTHVAAQQAALERIQANKPTAPPPVAVPQPEPETPAEAPAEEAAAEASTETSGEEAAPAEAAATEEAATEEAATEDKGEAAEKSKEEGSE